MNPFRKIANSLMNWWKGETAPEVSDSTELTGGVMTLNSPSWIKCILEMQYWQRNEKVI